MQSPVPGDRMLVSRGCAGFPVPAVRYPYTTTFRANNSTPDLPI